MSKERKLIFILECAKWDALIDKRQLKNKINDLHEALPEEFHPLLLPLEKVIKTMTQEYITSLNRALHTFENRIS
jgi:hypothetical protein